VGRVKGWLVPIAYVVMAATQVALAVRSSGATRLVTARLVTVAFAVALLALGAFFRPRRLRLAAHADAVAAAAQGRVVIYQRPGCPFCARLTAALGRTGREQAVWVDIWKDPQAAAYVRSVNDGNETVPTVVIDGTAHTNPPPARVKAALRG